MCILYHGSPGLKITLRESSFNMTRGGGAIKMLRGGSEDF